MRTHWLGSGFGLALLFVLTTWIPSAQSQDRKDPVVTRLQPDTSTKKIEDLQKKIDELTTQLTALAKQTDGDAKKTAEAQARLEKFLDEAKIAAAGDKFTDKVKAIVASDTTAAIKDAKDSADGAASAAKTAGDTAGDAQLRGDSAWMLTSSAFVMLMVPGLALFYAGMVRRKNVLATMMESMAALSIVGVFWIAFGYGLAFGPSQIKLSLLGVTDGGIVGWDWKFFFLQGVSTSAKLPGTNIPIYLHVMFQGMFAIITPALISGAIAERIRFWPFCIFLLVWVTVVYCPLAHMVWAFDWFTPDPVKAGKTLGASPIGLIGKMGALDFAGGTVVHIAAGLAGLAGTIVLRKRTGYPEHPIHPNSMVLTLIGAGLLWFGWFGFNGGSALNATPLAVSAFAATQAAAAAAALTWILAEWICKGKPTVLGFASGIVAGLVAVTPASGFVYMWGGLAIGAIAGVVCFMAVHIKLLFGYDDSLDAFGVHGIGGFLGAVLTGFFSYSVINAPYPDLPSDGFFAERALQGRTQQITPEIVSTVDELVVHLKPALAKAESEYSPLRAKLHRADAELKKALDAKADAEKKLADAKSNLDESSDSLAEAQSDPKPDQKKISELKAAKEEAEKSVPPLEKAVQEVSDKVAPLQKASDDTKKEVAIKKTTFEDASARVQRREESLKSLNEEKEKVEKDLAAKVEKGRTAWTQPIIQLKAATLFTVFAFVLSIVLFILVQLVTLGNFTTDRKSEVEGLDRTEHGEVGFDDGALDTSAAALGSEPRAAKAPPQGRRFQVVLDGIQNGNLISAWSALCQPQEGPIDADFSALYPYVTTIRGNRFSFRGGDPTSLANHLQKLFQRKLGPQIKARVEL